MLLATASKFGDAIIKLSSSEVNRLIGLIQKEHSVVAHDELFLGKISQAKIGGSGSQTISQVVLFDDSARLYQRLIELHKDDFTLSLYPLDRQAFANADSWLDEYKRIFRLFEAHLK